MPDTAHLATRTDTEHNRYDRLVAEVLRLQCELAYRAEPSAIDLLARATDAEAANEALRRAVAQAQGRITKAEAEARRWRDNLRVVRETFDEAAAQARERHIAAVADLEQVHATLAPLWPGNTGSAVELARLAALSLGAAEPHEAVLDLVDLGEVAAGEAAAKASGSFGVEDVARVAVGAFVVAAGIAAGVVRGWAW